MSPKKRRKQVVLSRKIMRDESKQDCFAESLGIYRTKRR